VHWFSLPFSESVKSRRRFPPLAAQLLDEPAVLAFDQLEVCHQLDAARGQAGAAAALAAAGARK
jgi:hypothetical protein